MSKSSGAKWTEHIRALVVHVNFRFVLLTKSIHTFLLRLGITWKLMKADSFFWVWLVAAALNRALKRHSLFRRKRSWNYFLEWSTAVTRSRSGIIQSLPRLQVPRVTRHSLLEPSLLLLGPISKFAPKEPIMQCLKGHKTAHRSQMIKPLRRALFLDRNFATVRKTHRP